MPDLADAAAHVGPRKRLMSEWWTYRPEDFLLFSPRVYWRMFELHNAALWPLHLLALAAGLIIIVLIAWRPGAGARWLAHILAILGCSSGGSSCGIATRPSTGLPPMSRRLSPLKACCFVVVSLLDSLAFAGAGLPVGQDISSLASHSSDIRCLRRYRDAAGPRPRSLASRRIRRRWRRSAFCCSPAAGCCHCCCRSQFSGVS